MRGPLVLGVLAALALAGCGGEQAEPPPTGVQGPMLLRLWDAEGRRTPGAEPTALLAARADQRGMGEEVRLHQVLVRRPLAGGGTLYVHADEAVSAGQGIELPGPVKLTGTWQGLPFTGTADRARIPAGGRLELDGLRLARGGTLASTPLLTALRERVDLAGPLRLEPGAPAANAALAALPPGMPMPLLSAPGR